ncbi:MAG TPA: hypothetical protein VD932_03710 [Aquabacterium sp.]|nr:hypothetical protein [Aquabacterium sp.]
MTPDELKTLLSTPLALFVVMLLGSLGSALKQVKGTDTSLGSYFAHWPETLSALIANVLAFGMLVVTDSLNFASALGIGYVANSAADLIRAGGRSDIVGRTTRQAGFARPILLAILLVTAVIAMPVLQGCTALGLQAPKTFADDYAYALSQTTALRTAAAQALNTRQISVADAQYVLALTDQSRSLLDTSRQVYEAGESLKGQSQLELATNILTRLQAYLNARQVQ